MWFIGDVHGKMKEYLSIINQLGNTNESIQVGDFGVGFVDIPQIPINHKFIHGNHDNLHLCATIPNFLGRYGTYKNIFFVSGAFSIDNGARTPNVNWWNSEELTYSEQIKCRELYNNNKPRVVVTHDCPFFLYKTFRQNVGGCVFVCLDELETFKI